jgi:4-diphosphocytidyl-2-C-methyl-D-erythritol kinase
VSGPAVRLAAQAKLNLHLRVLARESSGYHSIETIFHRIDLADDLLVEVTGGRSSLDVQGAETGPAEMNLAWRAAAAYSNHNAWPRGFRIELTKRIPVGAGLGGGSSDAAAVLRALDLLSPNPMGSHGLLQLAASLGADVPFLASDAVMAVAWGHGERLLSLPALPTYDVLLMSPAFSVSTADAYRWLDEDRAGSDGSELPDETEAIVIEPLTLSTWASIAKFARNDFESAVAGRHPEIRGYLDRLQNSRAILARMTGSGSTIFAVLDSPPDYGKVPEEHRTRVTTTKTSIDVVPPVRVG